MGEGGGLLLKSSTRLYETRVESYTFNVHYNVSLFDKQVAFVD